VLELNLLELNLLLAVPRMGPPRIYSPPFPNTHAAPFELHPIASFILAIHFHIINHRSRTVSDQYTCTREILI